MHTRHGDESTAEVIGCEILGPVLTAWADHVIARLTETPDLQALAVMRDGAVLGRALCRRAPSLASRVGQLWLSRRQAAMAAIANASDRENLINFLVRMRHRPARLAEVVAELDLPTPDFDDTSLATGNLGRVLDWLATPEVAARLERRVQTVRHSVLAHLGRDDAPILLLDVGYAGTVQRCLKRILALSGQVRPVHGVYLVTSPGARWAMTGDGLVEGVLGACGQPEEFVAPFLRHRDVVECLLAQPEGEHQLHAGGAPVCAASPLPPHQLAAAAHLQAAALSVVATHPGGVAEARNRLMRLLLHPTVAEAAVLGSWLHADSTALDGVRRLDDGPADGGRDKTLWPAAARLRTMC